MNAVGAALRTDLLVGGQWRAAADGARFEVTDPSSSAVIASVASASVGDAERAVDVAEAAMPAWAETSPRHRADVTPARSWAP